MRDWDGRLTKANIDHLAVVATGVWVVDATTHSGRLELRRSGGLFRPRTERLFINGRDQIDLVLGLAKQVAVVRAELERSGVDVPVRGALCFVGTELPWRGETIGDIPLLTPGAHQALQAPRSALA